MSTIADHELLVAALYGYQAQLKTIEAKIQEIRSEIGGSPKAVVASDVPPKSSKMSAVARKRMAAAQKARWAAYHKEHGTKPAAKKTTGKKKRVLGAAALKRISEATKKRWAAYRAQKAKAAM